MARTWARVTLTSERSAHTSACAARTFIARLCCTQRAGAIVRNVDKAAPSLGLGGSPFCRQLAWDLAACVENFDAAVEVPPSTARTHLISSGRAVARKAAAAGTGTGQRALNPRPYPPVRQRSRCVQAGNAAAKVSSIPSGRSSASVSSTCRLIALVGPAQHALRKSWDFVMPFACWQLRAERLEVALTLLLARQRIWDTSSGGFGEANHAALGWRVASLPSGILQRVVEQLLHGAYQAADRLQRAA
jgi:hypothetical protein